MGAYKQRVLELFARLDKEGSGGINPSDLMYVEELSGSRPTPLALGTRGLVLGFVRHSDANKDGRVSREELLHYVDKAMVGTTPETLPEYVREFVSTVFAVMDPDRSDRVTRAAFEEYLKAQHADVSFDTGGRELEHLDRDHDGFLTLGDLQAAAYAFFTAPSERVPMRWLLAAVPDRTAPGATSSTH
ncbi:EF-hand domain-containing protein [Streptomyces sp. NPDC092903]|uniref:EF-hand domain-containing protein n=1 Tax=Streptomyces sp. NPDC092903 TaxID=3366017 RepID=UPI00380C0934